MTDSKDWYRSKTVWGGIIALAAAAAGLLGVDVGPEQQGALAGALTDLAAAVGALLAIFGRFEADTMIR